MNLNTEMAIVEAVLFLENEPVDLKSLVRISGLSKETVEIVLDRLTDHYRGDEHGLELIKTADAYHFTPKKELWEQLKDRYGKKNDNKLSRAAIETLSIIAYSQPITRAEVESIRGVSVDATIRILTQKSLIQEVGKKEAPGRPSQYGTTKEFLKLFRLSSIAELPKLDELERQRFELN